MLMLRCGVGKCCHGVCESKMCIIEIKLFLAIQSTIWKQHFVKLFHPRVPSLFLCPRRFLIDLSYFRTHNLQQRRTTWHFDICIQENRNSCENSTQNDSTHLNLHSLLIVCSLNFHICFQFIWVYNQSSLRQFHFSCKSNQINN